MKNLPLTVRDLAQLVSGAVEGDGDALIRGLAAMDAAEPGDMTFAADERRAGQLAQSRASAALVAKEPKSAPMPLIRVADVNDALAKVLAHVMGDEDLPPAGVHPSASVAKDAKIGAGVAIGPNVVVGAGASIGDGCSLCANVVVAARSSVGPGSILFEGVVVRPDTVIGSRVRIGPGSVIGWDGFGYYFKDGVHHKVPHAGNVVIEDDVEIGACACIDKAKFGSTRVGAGTKIDNLVQIAHNVQIGRGCILVGQCGVAGSTKLGNYVIIGGSAGIRDNVTIGDGVRCAAFAAIANDIPAGQTVAGIPAGPAREQFRVIQALEKLPELLKTVRDQAATIADLKSQISNAASQITNLESQVASLKTDVQKNEARST